MGANTGVSVAAAKPRVGGGLYYVKGSTPLPTDASTALSTAILAGALGPISEDGVRPSRDTNVEKVKEWDGSTLAQLLTDESRSFEVTLYGVLDDNVLAFVNGAANVTTTAATSTTGKKHAVLDKGGKPDTGVFVIEMVYGGVKMRKVVPVGDAVVTGEEPYQGSSLMAYTVSIEALKDSAGVRVYEYDDDGKFTA